MPETPYEDSDQRLGGHDADYWDALGCDPDGEPYGSGFDCFESAMQGAYPLRVDQPADWED